jgi:hypothetical protein
MTNPLTELALEELEGQTDGPGRESAVALVARWRAGAPTTDDLRVLRELMVKIAEEVMRASTGGPKN